MNEPFELKEMPERYALVIRRTVPMAQLPQTIGESYHVLADYLGQMGAKPSDVPFTAYHNMDMENLQVEMGFPTERLLPEKDPIQAITLPAGLVVSGLYKGPYAGMESFYKNMTEWVGQQHLAPTGIYYEYYYNSPQEVPESELLTRIEWPVAKLANALEA